MGFVQTTSQYIEITSMRFTARHQGRGMELQVSTVWFHGIFWKTADVIMVIVLLKEILSWIQH
jgi:hypothetical protein